MCEARDLLVRGDPKARRKGLFVSLAFDPKNHQSGDGARLRFGVFLLGSGTPIQDNAFHHALTFFQPHSILVPDM
jgi:hypothetical protein